MDGAKNKPNKLTWERIIEPAIRRNGKCLADPNKKYITSDKVLWECAQQHQWKASIDNILYGNRWC